MSLTMLPNEIDYLHTYLSYLSELAPEDVNEETDVIALDEAVRKNLSGFEDEWRSRLEKDTRLLEGWLEDTSPANDYGFFVLSFLENFEKGDRTVAESMRKAKERKSGLFFSNQIEGASLVNEFTTLSVNWDDGLRLSLNYLEGEDSFLRMKKSHEHHRGKNENQITELKLGRWEVTKLVLQSSKPFFWKQAQYVLKDQNTFLLGTALNGGKKDFDSSRIDVVLATLES